METSFLWEIAAISTKTSFCAKHFAFPPIFCHAYHHTPPIKSWTKDLGWFPFNSTINLEFKFDSHPSLINFHVINFFGCQFQPRETKFLIP
jgi:hypothetical protein